MTLGCSATLASVVLIEFWPPITPEEIQYEEEHMSDNRTPSIIGGSILLILVATLTVILHLISLWSIDRPDRPFIKRSDINQPVQII